jgi:hypothetical protein
LLRNSLTDNKGSRFAAAFDRSSAEKHSYWGFLRAGGLRAGAGAALVSKAPFSITITKGLGV